MPLSDKLINSVALGVFSGVSSLLPIPKRCMSNPETQYEQAVRDLEGGNPQAALDLLRMEAEKGNAQAAYRLGMAHANGEGLPIDYIEASQWIAQSAEAGLAVAQRTLAWLYANGLGVTADDEQALRWYLKVAEHGDARDQHFAGTIYRYGRFDVDRNDRLMLDWYTKSANQGFAPAQYELGQMLMKGKRVQKDEELAFAWLSLAVVNGSKPATRLLTELSEQLGPDRLERVKQEMMLRVSEGAKA